MPPSPRKSIKEQSLTTSLPCASWLKAVLCSHMRSVWMALMALTVLSVAIQILGVVWQSRNDKLMSEKLLNVHFTIEIQRTLPPEKRGWESLRSPPAAAQEPMRSSEEGGALRQWSRGSQQMTEQQHARDQQGLEMRIHQQGDSFKSSDPALPGGLDETINTVLESKKEQRDVSETVLSKVNRNRLGLGHSGSLVQPEEMRSHMSTDQRNSDINMAPSQPHKPPWSLGHSLDSASEQRSLKGPAFSGISQSHSHSIRSNSDNSIPDKTTATSEDGTCRPKNHIVFLKTHKTASSTILNILYRYGDSRNLTFALPLNKHSQLFYPYYFASYFVEGVRSRSVREFHILCNHMRLRMPEVRKLMPQETFYFSILRNPVAMMESIFIYYKSIPAFHKARSLDDFLDNGWRSYNTSLTNNHYARNILTFDFGFDNNVAAYDSDLEARAEVAIGAIERDFNLILISEYFDESMILLKRALCWSLDDVVSFKLNSRSERTRHALSPLTADKIRTWNALDWRLYRHFNATFWQRVDATVGREEMTREVARLQERRAQLARTCLQDGRAVDPSQVKDAGLKPFQYGAAVIEGYNLNPGLDGPTRTRCQNLITPELQYTDALYAKQFPELAARHRRAAKMAASQRQPAMSRAAAMTGPVRVREARPRRTVRSGHRNPDIQNQNVPQSALSRHSAPIGNRNLP